MSTKSYEYFKWSFAIAIALLWHVLLWTRLDRAEANPEHHSPPHPPRMVFVPSVGGAAAAGDLMTPVLFSLPSSFGFSQPIADFNDGIMQDIYSSADEVALLNNPIAQSSHDLLAWPRHMDAQAAALLDNPILNQPRQVLEPELAIQTQNPVHVRLAGRLTEADFIAKPLEIGDTEEALKAWQASIRIEFDRSGIPRHVFIYSSSGSPDLDSDILNQLKRWRIEPSEAPLWGEVILQRN